jgi:hypothetical protein
VEILVRKQGRVELCLRFAHLIPRLVYWLQARSYRVEEVPSAGMHKSVSMERSRKGLGEFIPIRKVSLSGVHKRYIGDSSRNGAGTGSQKAPHNRSAHLRNVGGRMVHVRASMIHGGRTGPTIIHVER